MSKSMNEKKEVLEFRDCILIPWHTGLETSKTIDKSVLKE